MTKKELVKTEIVKFPLSEFGRKRTYILKDFKTPLLIERLPGMAHPVQVRPADVERRAERRLFLGLLPISFSAEHIREVFEPFGTIQEIQVLGSGNQSYHEI